MKKANIYIGMVLGVSKSGEPYYSKATQYRIASARINRRNGTPLGYVGVWRIKTKYYLVSTESRRMSSGLVHPQSISREDVERLTARSIRGGTIKDPRE